MPKDLRGRLQSPCHPSPPCAHQSGLPRTHLLLYGLLLMCIAHSATLRAQPAVPCQHALHVTLRPGLPASRPPGATALDKKARKKFEAEQLARIGAKAAARPRIPASIGVGMAKKQAQRDQRALEEGIAGGPGRRGMAGPP